MLVAGYAGEAGLNKRLGRLYRRFGRMGIHLVRNLAGEAGRASAEKAPASVQSAF